MFSLVRIKKEHNKYKTLFPWLYSVFKILLCYKIVVTIFIIFQEMSLLEFYSYSGEWESNCNVQGSFQLYWFSAEAETESDFWGVYYIIFLSRHKGDVPLTAQAEFHLHSVT